MEYQIFLIDDAKEDIIEIYSYILKHDSLSKADYVLNNIEKLCESLENMPESGHIPPELARINVTGYLELHFKPYRVIYEIDGKQVFVHCVLDGRRELDELLSRRLLR